MMNARNRRPQPARTTSTIRNLAAACLALTLPLSVAATATAAPIRNATPYSVSGDSRPAVVLDQDGRRIAVPRAGRELPEGTTPTYLAYRLPGRSQVPDGVPAVAITPSRDAVGPLRLSPQAIQSLNAQLDHADQVAVLGPRQAFLVASATGPKLDAAEAAVQYWRANIEDVAGGKSFGDTVQGWYDSSADAVKDLNDKIADAFKKAFNPDPIKPVIIGPPRVAAQVLNIDEAVDAAIAASTIAAQRADELAAEIQAAPVPEPAAWLVFAAAAAFGLRLRRRHAA